MTPDRWKQIKEVFQSLVECTPEEREQRLEHLCAGDAELRRELDRLLESDRRAQSFLEVSPVEPRRTASSRRLEGQMIGAYRIVKLLGRGGMGEVYQARDGRLDRIVALKVLPEDVARDPERLKRFVLEAKAASALSHPNVATIYEIDQRNGNAFIAMEYIEGQTLQEKMKGGRMSAIEIRTVARQVAEALEAAHRKGITHRDIKPANVMITARGEVKVLDFGLAKMSPEAMGDVLTAIRTLSGVLMGTVEYMSPEQALGREVDYRTDIFSLGVVLYEMATDRSPFAGISIGETIDRILHDEPDPISRLNPRIPRELERVIHRCLEKAPEQRYQSASELLADLRERQLTRSLPRTIKNSVVRPKWLIAGTVCLLVWSATLALIVFLFNDKSPTGDSNLQAVESRSPDVPAREPTPVDTSANRTGNAGPLPKGETSKTNGDNGANRSGTTSPAGATDNRAKIADAGNFAGANTTSPGANEKIPTIVDTIYYPLALTVDAGGNIYLADYDGGRIFKVTASGSLSTIAGTGTPGFGGDGGPATSAQLSGSLWVAADSVGNVFIADVGNYRIRKVTPAGVISTIAGNGIPGFSGDGGPAISAQLGFSRGLAVDRAGNLYISESARIRKVNANGVITTISNLNPALVNTPPFGLSVSDAGDIYVADSANSKVLKVTQDGMVSTVAGDGTAGYKGDGGPAISAQLSRPMDVVVDSMGDLYISDFGNSRIRRVTPAGVISTVAGGGNHGVTANVDPATSVFIVPNRLAADAKGNLFILQTGATGYSQRYTVAKVTPGGFISMAVGWRGDILPIRVGQGGLNQVRISTAASFLSDGDTIYPQGMPQIIVSDTSRVDATVSVAPVPPNCRFVFEISPAESPTKPALAEPGTAPSLKVTGQLKSGIYNLTLRVPADPPKCFNGATFRSVLRFVVNVTSR